MFDLVSYLKEKRAEAYHTIQELELYNELDYLEKEIGLKIYYDQQHLIVDYINDQIDEVECRFLNYHEMINYFNFKLKEMEDLFQLHLMEFDSLDFAHKSRYLGNFMSNQQHILEIVSFLNETKHEYNSNFLIRIHLENRTGDINVR